MYDAVDTNDSFWEANKMDVRMKSSLEKIKKSLTYITNKEITFPFFCKQILAVFQLLLKCLCNEETLLGYTLDKLSNFFTIKVKIACKDN